MNLIRISLVLLVSVFISCGSQPVKVQPEKSENTKLKDIDRLENFFRRSEKDSVNAGSVLEKYKIIQHLTHLRRMDSGGKKYYLLEKDDITRMINSVTEGIYLDYILINKHGDIVYTNRNEALFGSNISSGYEQSPLQKCFSSRTGIYFADVSYITPSSDIYSLYISSPVYVEGAFHGVLILQVDVKKISEMLDAGSEIFSRDGIIRVSSLMDRVFLQYPGYENIDLEAIDKNGYLLMNNNGGKIRYSKFNFKEISWILMNKDQ